MVNNCKSLLLIGFCSQLYDLNIRYRYAAARAFGYEGRKIGDEHQQILDAVLSNNFDRVKDLLVVHYETTGAYVMPFITDFSTN